LAADRTQTLIRWAAFAGIAMIVVRRLVYRAFPDFLPSSAWRPELWGAGLLLSVAFELLLLTLLIGVPAGIYYFKLRTGAANARDLAIDCAAAGSLYLAALFLL
jgi:hypothetical protein